MPEEISPEKHLEILEKRLAREKNARKQAEAILNDKARELYEANVALMASEELLKESLNEQTKLLIQAQEIARIGSFKWDISHDRFYGSEFFWKLLKISKPIENPKSALRMILGICETHTYTEIMYFLRGVLKAQHKSEVREEKQLLQFDIDGNRRIFISRLQVVYDEEGKPKQILGIIQDITRSKVLEQELRDNQDQLEKRVDELEEVQSELSKANESIKSEAQKKTEFMSSVSHELRTPLTSIHASLGMITNTMEGAVPDAMNNMLDIAYRNSERLKNLIDDVLDVEKFEAGKLEFNLHHYDTETLLADSIILNEGYAEKYGVKLVRKENNPSCTVFVDSERFQQVMSNLISNAAKHSNSGGEVLIGTELLDVKDGKGYARISVEDKGAGIPEEFHEDIFNKFTQASKGNKRSSDGTGLGLFLTKQFVERLQGEISFKSELGKGTVFYVTLPCLAE